MTELNAQPNRPSNPPRERWAVLGAVVLLLAAVAVPQAFRRSASRGPETLPYDGPPLRPSSAGQFRGITMQLHSADAKIPFEQYVEEIARTGANTICLSLAALQENCGSSSVFIEYRKVPSRERLEGLIRLARRLGLRVVLMPIILLENPRAGEWRGKIDPPNPADWWEDYENILLHYARVAEKTGAEMVIIGSELVLMEKHTDRWRRLIRMVRKAYAGKLTYSANWDHYENIEWWHDLDMVGMNVYHDLVGDKEPTLDVLLKSWKRIKKENLAWQRKMRLPILFTEVGWPSQQGCAKEPWNYYGSTVPDLKTQDLCLLAFLKTWAEEPAVAGILIWEWRNHPGQVGGLEDTSYVPIGKPVMQTLREYFLTPGRGATSGTAPAQTAPASRGATRRSANTGPRGG